MKNINFLLAIFIVFGLISFGAASAFNEAFESQKTDIKNTDENERIEPYEPDERYDEYYNNKEDKNRKDENRNAGNSNENENIDIVEMMPRPGFISPKQQSILNNVIDIKIEVKDASSVEFYSRRSESLIPTYIGRAQPIGNNIWKLEFDTAQYPNGTYNIFPKIVNKYGEYSGEGITVKIKNIAERKTEKEKELKREIKEVEKNIEQEDKKIEQEKEELKKGIKEEINKSIEKTENITEELKKEEISSKIREQKEKADKEIDEEIEKLADKIKREQELRKQIKEKEETKEEMNEKIMQAQKEMENLPEAPIPILKKDKQEKLKNYKEEKKEIEKQIKNVKEELEKIKIKKNDSQKKIIEIVEKVVEPIKNTADAEVKSKIKNIEEKTKTNIAENLKKLETSIIKTEKKKIEKTKVLLKDSDNDEIPDAEEIRMGTDPLNPDSDGDGFLDGIEYMNGFDPLNPSPAKKIIYQDPRKVKPKKSDIYVVEQIESEILPDGQTGLKIKGKGLPNSFVTLYIFSEPIVMVVKTDENGNWEYALDKQIADGQHTVYVAVTNNKGEIEARSEPFVFAKSGNKVFRVFESPHLAEISSPVYTLEKSYTILIAGIVILNIMLALLLIGVLARTKTN